MQASAEPRRIVAALVGDLVHVAPVAERDRDEEREHGHGQRPEVGRVVLPEALDADDGVKEDDQRQQHHDGHHRAEAL